MPLTCDMIDTRLAYEEALAGALDRRGLPKDIAEAYRAAAVAESRKPYPMHARIREAQLEAHRLMLAAT